MVSLDEDDLKVLHQRIEDEKIIVNRELDEVYKKTVWLGDYVRHMTYFCSGVAVVLILVLYKLFSKGIFTFSFF